MAGKIEQGARQDAPNGSEVALLPPSIEKRISGLAVAIMAQKLSALVNGPGRCMPVPKWCTEHVERMVKDLMEQGFVFRLSPGSGSGVATSDIDK